MKIETVPLAKIKPAPYNPRKISPEALARLGKLIDKFGLVDPLIWNKRTGHLVGGHQRIKILTDRKVKEAQCVVVDLPLVREKALNIALNNTAVMGEFDFSMLADTLAEIDTGEFDVAELTGFDAAELERIANWAPEVEETTTQDEQGRLDEKQKTKCPKCGHEFEA